MTITVTITSDFICPWCLIGERRLSKAIDSLPDGMDVELKWLPFELNSDMRPEGMDRKTYRSLKFGSWERSRLLDAHTIEAAKGDGVAFDYPAIERTPNTLFAHRLMQWAQEQGSATSMANRIFSAYFEHGRDIGNAGVLADIAAENGIDRAQAAAFLAGGGGTEAVRDLELSVQNRGVRSVPSFDIDGEIVSGAQPVEIFEAALRRAAERGSACTAGACTVASRQ
ncbi:DsbA family oxidoreductase [Mesorhizobium sp. B2-3-5]|uniref:DsbA family oxidoreductase n=1 Tax=Mesorhizobium sp. B2-3-5 TaxID=2589958 RepID=UPI00112AB111|nr:DsbA family oxidoreductase [Mesorhizobium sp. B2-3-5]TPM24800.1 DsbA family oxidoreductase [Mesorhizobium sp. B2-3-5]